MAKEYPKEVFVLKKKCSTLTKYGFIYKMGFRAVSVRVEDAVEEAALAAVAASK